MITICYNAGKCIAHTIESVLFQTLPVFEYIIVDGNSQDTTMYIVKKYEYRFKKKGIGYKYISEMDEGISDAINKGIRMASGDLVGLIHAGDEMMPRTHTILQNIYKDSDTDIYYGNCIWVDIKNNLQYIQKPKEKNTDMMKRLLYEMVLIHPSTFIRKNAYENYGYYDVTFKYCMDQELLYRMFKQGAVFFYINEILSKITSGGISDINPRKVFREASKIAQMDGEPIFKISVIEIKKVLRDKFSRAVKKLGLYKYKKT